MTQMICNICGANYTYQNGRWICPACGAYRAEAFSGEEITLLCHAAQALRLNSFDLAEDLYGDTIRQYPQNPLGHWGFCLAKYGIKYETDTSGRAIPTCYKSEYSDIRRDASFQKALELADDEHKLHFAEEAERIAAACEEWRREASRYSYDVFISFKATDEDGGETEDLREMQDLYAFLTERGYKVFFSPVSMRAYAGKSYDAYIFNALDTARVMILYGSRAEYFSATWISNEWTRYQRRIDRGEKPSGSLILAYKNLIPEDLPRQLRHLQALDAGKKTFYLDLLQAIEVIPVQKSETASVFYTPQAAMPPLESSKKKRKKLTLKKSFFILLLHAAAFIVLGLTGAIIADAMGAEIEEIPVANAFLWSAVAVLFLSVGWAIKTLWELLKALFRALKKAVSK